MVQQLSNITNQTVNSHQFACKASVLTAVAPTLLRLMLPPATPEVPFPYSFRSLVTSGHTRKVKYSVVIVTSE